jgi:hypothetical protein
MAQKMTGVEIHCIGRWVRRCTFEQLVERLGESHAADIWDMVAKHGTFTARNGLVYLRCVPLL